MKKLLLMSLIAAFVSVFSLSAQDNTYSMIIKMANGTTLTIGPNEVDNISFNNGQVTVAGATITELLQKVEDLQNSVQNNTAPVIEIKDGIWYINGESTGQSAKGEKGDKGDMGEKGEKGDMGPMGEKGRDGEAGVAGRDAIQWTIGDDGYWYANGEKTEFPAVAQGGGAVDLSNYYNKEDVDYYIWYLTEQIKLLQEEIAKLKDGINN